MKKIVVALALITHLAVFSMQDSPMALHRSIAQGQARVHTYLNPEIETEMARIIGNNFESLVNPDDTITNEQYLQNIEAIWKTEEAIVVSHVRERFLKHPNPSALIFAEASSTIPAELVSKVIQGCLCGIDNSGKDYKSIFNAQARVLRNAYRIHKAK